MINSHIYGASEYNLTHEQKLSFPHNIFEEEARLLYRREVEKVAQTFGVACDIMRGEFSCVVRYKHLRQYLQSLRLKILWMRKKAPVPLHWKNRKM